MYNKILLAVDFDDISVKAAHKAKQISEAHNAEFHIVHVIEPVPTYAYPGFAGFADVESTIFDQAKSELIKLQQALQIDEQHTHLSEGSIKHEVLDLARELDVDLIIAGSHGKHGLSRILGSTANAILHGAERDVLIIRSADND